MFAQTLESLASAATTVDGVRVGDLQPGDCLVILTKNSRYVLRVNADGTFDAEGGWFALQDPPGLPAEASAKATETSTDAGLPTEPAEKTGRRRRVIGCTWGGSVVLTRMVAAPGMFLEFDNRVRTTRIREVRHLRAVAPSTVH